MSTPNATTTPDAHTTTPDAHPRRASESLPPSPSSTAFHATPLTALVSYFLLFLMLDLLLLCRRPASGQPPSRLGCPARFIWQVEEGGVQREAVDPPSSKAQASSQT
jgi:hypothetical protein